MSLNLLATPFYYLNLKSLGLNIDHTLIAMSLVTHGKSTYFPKQEKRDKLRNMKIQQLKERVEDIHDPRRQYGYLQHKLVTIVIIALCAIVCGAEDYEDIEEFGKARREWLSKFLDIQNGIPDKDTFRRVFERLNPSEVAECLYNWLGDRETANKTVNIDGKTICGSKTQATRHIMLCLRG